MKTLITNLKSLVGKTITSANPDSVGYTNYICLHFGGEECVIVTALIDFDDNPELALLGKHNLSLENDAKTLHGLGVASYEELKASEQSKATQRSKMKEEEEIRTYNYLKEKYGK